MRQLVILSGKGGTGKTTLASALISLSRTRAYADCDVDAPNLHLVVHMDALPVQTAYFGSQKAAIQLEKCTGCGLCAERCPLNNIRLQDKVPQWGNSCTHCMACIDGCPAQAIEYKKATAGKSRNYNIAADL